MTITALRRAHKLPQGRGRRTPLTPPASGAGLRLSCGTQEAHPAPLAPAVSSHRHSVRTCTTRLAQNHCAGVTMTFPTEVTFRYKSTNYKAKIQESHCAGPRLPHVRHSCVTTSSGLRETTSSSPPATAGSSSQAKKTSAGLTFEIQARMAMMMVMMVMMMMMIVSLSLLSLCQFESLARTGVTRTLLLYTLYQQLF